MLVQEQLIARVRADERLDAALMYGSFAAGEADAHSDIEFWLFFLPQRCTEVDPWAWCAQVAPLTHIVRNEFGTHVAFFPGLVRGEFHFATTDDIPTVRTWPARGAPVDPMVVLDRSATLRPALQSLPEGPAVPGNGEEIETVCGRFANWLILAHQTELPPQDLAQLRHATATADPDDVRAALRVAWRSGRRYWTELAQLHHRAMPHSLLAEIDGTL